MLQQGQICLLGWISLKFNGKHLNENQLNIGIYKIDYPTNLDHRHHHLHLQPFMDFHRSKDSNFSHFYFSYIFLRRAPAYPENNFFRGTRKRRSAWDVFCSTKQLKKIYENTANYCNPLGVGKRLVVPKKRLLQYYFLAKRRQIETSRPVQKILLQGPNEALERRENRTLCKRRKQCPMGRLAFFSLQFSGGCIFPSRKRRRSLKIRMTLSRSPVAICWMKPFQITHDTGYDTAFS